MSENERKVLSLLTEPNKKQKKREKEREKNNNEISCRWGSLGISFWRGFNVVEGYNGVVV